MKTQIITAALLFALHSNVSAYTKADALLNAIESQNVALVDSLVRTGIDPNLDIELYNTTPLMHAVDTSTVEIVESLINHGSKVDVADSSGTTPLMYSIKTNKKDIAALLIKRSRNINMKDNSGASALHYAAKKGNEAIFQQIMQRGADIQAIDAKGNNALFHALTGRNNTIINNLIASNKINLAHKNSSGDTAQKVALRIGLNDVAKRISKGRN